MTSLSASSSPVPEAVQGVLLLVEDDPDHAFLVRRNLRALLQPELEVVHLSTAAAHIGALLRAPKA